MERFVGLDGYPKGWVAVSICGGRRDLDYFASVTEALSQPFAFAAIDMPIGLPEFGYRVCDIEARKLLGSDAPRVFLGARRLVLAYATQPEASAAGRARGDKGVSAQLFALSPKLRQVDDFVSSGHEKHVLECHPELVFRRLNNRSPVPRKKTAEGLAHRRALLEADGFTALDAWIGTRIGRGARIDDIYDACACAIAARERAHRVPQAEPECDSTGLPMQIYY